MWICGLSGQQQQLKPRFTEDSHMGMLLAGSPASSHCTAVGETSSSGCGPEKWGTGWDKPTPTHQARFLVFSLFQFITQACQMYSPLASSLTCLLHRSISIISISLGNFPTWFHSVEPQGENSCIKEGKKTLKSVE